MSKINVSEKDVQYYKSLFEQEVVFMGKKSEIFTTIKNILNNEVSSVGEGHFTEMKVEEDGSTIRASYLLDGVVFNDATLDDKTELVFSMIGHFEENDNALVIDNMELL
jgi:predicted nucleic acid-binding protein